MGAWGRRGTGWRTQERRKVAKFVVTRDGADWVRDGADWVRGSGHGAVRMFARAVVSRDEWKNRSVGEQMFVLRIRDVPDGAMWHTTKDVCLADTRGTPIRVRFFIRLACIS